MEWQSFLNRQQKAEGLKLYIRPFSSDFLNTPGQLDHGSDVFMINPDESVEPYHLEEESSLDKHILRNLAFEICVIEDDDEEQVAYQIGHCIGYYSQAGQTLRYLIHEDHEEIIEDVNNSYICEYLEALYSTWDEPHGKTPLSELIYYEEKDADGIQWRIDPTASIFILSTLSLHHGFARAEIISALIHQVIPNYFKKHRGPFGIDGIIYAEGDESAEDHFLFLNLPEEDEEEHYEDYKTWLWETLKNIGMEPYHATDNLYLISRV